MQWLVIYEVVTLECVVHSQFAVCRLNHAEHIKSLVLYFTQRSGAHLSSILVPLCSDAVCRSSVGR